MSSTGALLGGGGDVATSRVFPGYFSVTFNQSVVNCAAIAGYHNQPGDPGSTPRLHLELGTQRGLRSSVRPDRRLPVTSSALSDQREAWRFMDMNKMMQQVQQLQAQMEKAQEELKNETVEASAGGGMVTVKATGDLQITEIKISPEAIDPDDPELLADMVLAAVNEALRSAQSLAQSKLGGMAGLGDLGGMGLPGM